MVTVVTIKTTAGGGIKNTVTIVTTVTFPTHPPSLSDGSQTGRWSAREWATPWLWAAAVQHGMCGDDGTHAVVDDTVYRRLRLKLPQEPHPPRRAHGTLQPQDESVIVGYYTSEEVFPRNLRFQKSKFRRYFAYGKRRRY